MFLCNTPHSYKGELDKPVLEHTVTVVFSLDPGFHPIVLVEGDGVAVLKSSDKCDEGGAAFFSRGC